MIRYLVIVGTACAFAAMSVPTWALTADNVQCAGCVGNKDLSKNAVDKRKLKKNSVTSKKIKNRSIRRKDISPKALVGPKNVVEVTAKGGDFKNPVSALDSITNASALNRYLVMIGPGVYDLGASTLQMKPYVDIRGAGPGTTTLRGTAEGDPTHTDTFELGVVTGAENAALEYLSVEHTGGGVDSAIAIFNEASSFVLRHVAANATGAATDAAAAIRDTGAARMSHINATANNSAASIGGIFTSAGSITNAVVSVSGSAASTIGIAAGTGSRVQGIDVTAIGATSNLAVFAANATVRNVQALASGGTNTFGLLAGGGVLSGVTVDAQGGTGQNLGVLIGGGSLTSVRSVASGPGANISLQISGTGARITNTVLSGIPVDGDLPTNNCRDVRDLNLGAFQC